MSRIDKRLHQAAVLQSASEGGGGDPAALANVRLFAFSNHVKGYQPQFAPEAPVMILKSKSTKPNVHPCAQWSELSTALFRRNQCRDPQYVVDTTGLSPQLELEEDASQILCGPVAKRAINVVARLNPKGATLVAAGASSVLGMKLVLLADRKRNSRGDALFRTVVVVCPASVEPFHAMVAHASKHHRNSESSDGMLWELVVLVAAADQARKWKSFLTHPTTKAFFPSFRLVTQCAPLFEAIADAIQAHNDEGGANDDVADADEEGLLAATRLPSPRVFQITFVLSRYTKQVEQDVELSDLSEWRSGAGVGGDGSGHSSAPPPQDAHQTDANQTYPNTADMHHQHPVVEQPSVRARSTTAPHRMSPPTGATNATVVKQPPLCELMHVHDERFTVDAYVVDPLKGLVANAFGTIALVAGGSTATDKPKDAAGGNKQPSPIAQYAAGEAIRAHVFVRRSLKGRTSLQATAVDRLSTEQTQASPSLASTSADAASWVNVSAVAQSFGVVIVRGLQCVLVRSLSGEYRGMRMPHQLHDDGTQSGMECAIEAACVQCDISEDNFGIHPFIAPVTYYPAPATCVTIYAAVANFAPPPTPEQSASSAVNLNDCYDWLSFNDARQALTTKAERHALTRLAENIQLAASAGMYVPPHRLGIFGEAPTCGNNTTRGSADVGGRDGSMMPATEGDADDATEAPSVVVVHTSAEERGAVLESLVAKAFCVEHPVTEHCLFVKGVLGCDTPMESVVSWLSESRRASPSPSSANTRYVVLDPSVGAEGVDPVGDLWVELEGSGNGRWGRMQLVAFLSSGCVRFLAALAAGSAVTERPYERVRNIVAGVESADVVLVHPVMTGAIGCGDADEAQFVALDFVRLVLADAPPIPVIADWDNPSEFLHTEAEEAVPEAATVHHASELGRAASPFAASKYFSVWTYLRKAQPFHPQRFAAVTSSTGGVLASCGPAMGQLLCAKGYAWLSTRFGYRADVRVACDDEEAVTAAAWPTERVDQLHLALAQGHPWWCLVDEADRPSDTNPSTWDQRHGDRQQNITFVFAKPHSHQQDKDVDNDGGSRGDAVDAWPEVLCGTVANLEAVLDAMLCPPSEWRVWQRHPDPLPSWE